MPAKAVSEIWGAKYARISCASVIVWTSVCYHEMQAFCARNISVKIVKEHVWHCQTHCLTMPNIVFGTLRHNVLQAKIHKLAPQRYSLTILTLIADSIFHNYSHFKRLFRIYFATFSMSKFFIIFRPETKFWQVWHGFCREGNNGKKQT